MVDFTKIDKLADDGKQAIDLTIEIVKIIGEKRISFEALGIFLESMSKSYEEEKVKRNG